MTNDMSSTVNTGDDKGLIKVSLVVIRFIFVCIYSFKLSSYASLTICAINALHREISSFDVA